jgi:hypothetical protein
MPPRRQPPKDDRVEVPEVDGMLAQTFRLHCQTRHPGLGFWEKNEHKQDHRLRGEYLDHVHTEPENGPEEEDKNAEA